MSADSISIDELAARVLADVQASRLIVAVSNDSLSNCRALAESLRGLNSPTPRLLERPTAIEEAASLVSGSGELLFVCGLDRFGSEEWAQLDALRSRRFQTRGAPVVLFLGDDALRLLEQHAPNVFSFAQGSVFTIAGEPTVLSEIEREARLQTLRKWANLTDEQVRLAATEGTLSDEPEFAEWLLLLRQRTGE